jgi:predicted nucleic acid-binding protein
MIVLDCSVFIAGTLTDEKNQRARALLKKLSEPDCKAIVPSLFFAESANVLLNALRCGRITHNVFSRYLATIALLPLAVDGESLSPYQIEVVAALANRYHLSIYDAVYLEVAQRHRATLATLDKTLAIAAEHAGVSHGW